MTQWIIIKKPWKSVPYELNQRIYIGIQKIGQNDQNGENRQHQSHHTHLYGRMYFKNINDKTNNIS